MQRDIEANYPGVYAQIVGVNEHGHEADNALASDGRNLPLLQDVDADNNGLSDVWHDSWNVQWRDVVILDGNNSPVSVYNVTTNDLGVAGNYSTLLDILIDPTLH
jgi:hypothetical protein